MNKQDNITVDHAWDSLRQRLVQDKLIQADKHDALAAKAGESPRTPDIYTSGTRAGRCRKYAPRL